MAEDIYPINNGQRICDQVRTTNWLAGSFMTILRQYFGETDRITLEKGKYQWQPGITQTDIQIDVVDNLKFDEGNKHPKILVDIEDQNFPQDVLADLGQYIEEGGVREITNRNVSAISVECWGLFKLESASIADEVRYFLQAYRKEIAQKYHLKFLRITKLLKPVKYKLFKDYWVCRLIIETDIEERWGVAQESLKASKFSLALSGTP